ncbi:MAG: hypothetical protein ACI39E_06425 [Acutalibacteraceae bacterium]
MRRRKAVVSVGIWLLAVLMLFGGCRQQGYTVSYENNGQLEQLAADNETAFDALKTDPLTVTNELYRELRDMETMAQLREKIGIDCLRYRADKNICYSVHAVTAQMSGDTGYLFVSYEGSEQATDMTDWRITDRLYTAGFDDPAYFTDLAYGVTTLSDVREHTNLLDICESPLLGGYTQGESMIYTRHRFANQGGVRLCWQSDQTHEEPFLVSCVYETPASDGSPVWAELLLDTDKQLLREAEYTPPAYQAPKMAEKQVRYTDEEGKSVTVKTDDAPFDPACEPIALTKELEATLRRNSSLSLQDVCRQIGAGTLRFCSDKNRLYSVYSVDTPESDAQFLLIAYKAVTALEEQAQSWQVEDIWYTAGFDDKDAIFRLLSDKAFEPSELCGRSDLFSGKDMPRLRFADGSCLTVDGTTADSAISFCRDAFGMAPTADTYGANAYGDLVNWPDILCESDYRLLSSDDTAA